MESGQRTAESRDWVCSLRCRVAGMAAVLAGVMASSAAFADNEAEELGHHWEMPAYIGEIRLQLAAMAVVTLAIAASLYVARLRSKRGARS